MNKLKHNLKQFTILFFVLGGIFSLSSCLKSKDDKFDEFNEYLQTHINDRWKVSYLDESEENQSAQQWYIVFNRNANDYQYTFSETPVSESYDLVMKALSMYDPYSGLFFINTLKKRGEETLRQSVYQLNLDQDDILLVEKNHDSDSWGREIRLSRASIKDPFQLAGSWKINNSAEEEQVVQFNPEHELIVSTPTAATNQQIKGYIWRKETAVLEIYDSPSIEPNSKVIDYYIAKTWTDTQIVFQSYKGQLTLQKKE